METGIFYSRTPAINQHITSMIRRHLFKTNMKQVFGSNPYLIQNLRESLELKFRAYPAATMTLLP